MSLYEGLSSVSCFLLGEIVRPIHERTKELGMSEKDVEELVDEVVAEVRSERPLWKR